MPKIQMSDVTSGSENVKALFRLPMSARLKSAKLKIPLTDSELGEVLKLAEKEQHDTRRWFLQELIKKQPGPFNKKTFDTYLIVLFDQVANLELLKKSETSISVDEKLKWIQYTGVSYATWIIYDFLISGESKKYGIDVFAYPYNSKASYIVIEHILRKLDYNGRKQALPTLFKFFDSMTEQEMYKFYLMDMSIINADLLYMIIMEYSAMPTRVVNHYFHSNVGSVQSRIATHPNCPADIRKEMFMKTSDPSYLPRESVDIFIW